MTKSVQKKTRNRTPSPQFAICWDFIKRYSKETKSFPPAQVISEQNDWPRSRVYQILDALIEQGKIEKLSRYHYQIKQ